MIMRYWYVPEYTSNVKEVPELLDKFMISYDIKVVSSKKTGKVEGYIFKFRCLPILYMALKAWCKTGNGLAELEIRTVK